MSITDELREFIAEQQWCAKGTLSAIADRIDAEHEAKVSYWQGASYKDGYDEGFASADDWLAQHEDAMAEHGWVKLPVDADGEYIHVGDVVDVMPTDKFTGHRDVVVTSVIFKHSAALVTVDTADRPFTFMPNRIRHHQEPTVEDVLREFAEKITDSQIPNVHPTYEEAIAEYAAKLRLAEDSQTREEVLQSN